MAKKNTKETIVSIPVLGYAARVASNVAALPKHQQAALEVLDKQTRDIESLRQKSTNEAPDLTN
jgi:hypothetical protein